MKLFFAYVLAVCPAINSVICILITIFCGCFFVCILAMANEPEGSDAYKKAKESTLFAIKVLALLAALWVLIPSQERLNAMMLNYHAGCVDVRDEYGVPQGDK